MGAHIHMCTPQSGLGLLTISIAPSSNPLEFHNGDDAIVDVMTVYAPQRTALPLLEFSRQILVFYPTLGYEFFHEDLGFFLGFFKDLGFSGIFSHFTEKYI